MKKLTSDEPKKYRSLDPIHMHTNVTLFHGEASWPFGWQCHNTGIPVSLRSCSLRKWDTLMQDTHREQLAVSQV
jgi:hypothetical protein